MCRRILQDERELIIVASVMKWHTLQTFTGAEVEAVLRLAAEIAKKHVENGDIVDFGDIGTLTPSFQSKLVEKGKAEFNPKVHITKPVVHLTPSKKYFTLTGVSYERVFAPEKETKKPAKNHSQSGPEIAES